jgi:16S rRNA G966 N2-methylase RsmD
MCNEIIAEDKSIISSDSRYCERCIRIVKAQRSKELARAAAEQAMQEAELKRQATQLKRLAAQREKRREERERRIELGQRVFEEKKYSLDYCRQSIESDGLDSFAINAKIGIKLKRNERLYYIGGDSQIDLNTKIKLITTNQRLFFILDDHPIFPISDSCEFISIKEGLVSKPISGIIYIDPPYHSEDYRSWHVKLHFDNGKVILLNFNTVQTSRMFYTILSELIDRVNDPIQEECLSLERQRIPDEVKIVVWRRDGGSCVKCGNKENLEFDHIVPVSKGGSNTIRNIELLCEKCNRTKGKSI